MSTEEHDLTEPPERGEVPVDEELPGPSTPLSELERELKAEVEQEPTTLAVPGRPGYAVRYSTDLDAEVLSQWQKASEDRAKPDGIDVLALSLRILANQCQVVIRNGEELRHEGQPLTVRSAAFIELVGGLRPLDATRKFYGVDGHVLAAAEEVVVAAGYGEDVLAGGADPTTEP